MISQPRFTIGFSNLSETEPFCITVREGLEAAITEYPGLTLICRDNNMDDMTALAHAQEFADLPVDIAIIYHINERIGDKIRHILTSKNPIPIIAVDIPIPWTTYFGVNNRQAGVMVGNTLGHWIKTHWKGHVDKILVMTDSRVQDDVRLRTDSAIDTLASLVSFKASDVQYLDSGNVRSLTIERTRDILHCWSESHHIAMVGFNEESTLGLAEVARLTGRTNDVILIGQGADKEALEELRTHNTPLVAVVGYRPYSYGAHLVDLALQTLRGEPVAARNYVELDLFTSQNIPR